MTFKKEKKSQSIQEGFTMRSLRFQPPLLPDAKKEAFSQQVCKLCPSDSCAHAPPHHHHPL